MRSELTSAENWLECRAVGRFANPAVEIVLQVFVLVGREHGYEGGFKN